MDAITHFLDLPGIGLDITFLSTILALLGGLYLAYEFLDRPRGFLRLPLQISLPVLAAILVSIPSAILVFLIELLPPVQDFLSGSLLSPIAFIVCGAFVGLFHGVFSNRPTTVEDKPSNQNDAADAKRKPDNWSRIGVLQGLVFGGLLGFLYTLVMAATLTASGQNFIDFIYSQNFVPDVIDSGVVAVLAALAGMVWRGRLQRPLSRQPGDTQDAQHRSLSWQLVKSPYTKLRDFLLEDVSDGGDKPQTEKETALPVAPALTASRSLPAKQSEPKSHKRFVKKEGDRAFRFWLVIALLITLLFVIFEIIFNIIISRSPGVTTTPILTQVFQTLFLCLAIILMLVLPGWMAGGLSSHMYWVAHKDWEHGAKKMLGYTGVILTLFAFGLQLIQPLAQELKPLTGFDGSVISIAWSPSGSSIAILGQLSQRRADRIEIIQPDTGKLINTYDLNSRLDANASLLWSDDEAFIASYDNSENVQIWNLQNGSSIFMHGASALSPSLAWSPTSSNRDDYLAVAWNNTGSVQVEDATTGRESFMLSCPMAGGQQVYGAGWSSDGKYFASIYGSIPGINYDHSMPFCIWNMQTRKLVAAKQITSDYLSLAYNQTKVIAGVKWSASNQRSTNTAIDEIFWPVEAKQYLNTYFYDLPPNTIQAINNSRNSDNPLSVSNVMPSNDEMYIAISRDNLVDIWNMQWDEHILTYNGHYSSVTAIAWSSDGVHIATGDEGGVIEIWDAMTGTHLLTYSPTG